jgi:hypothetical protein
MLFLILGVLFVLFVLECVFTEVEHFGWATVTLLATMVGSVVCHHLWGTYSVLDFVRDHGVWTLLYVGAYVGVGVGWSFVKWFSYLMSFRDAFHEQKDAFCLKNGLDSKVQVPEDKMEAFERHLASNVGWSTAHRGQLLSMERPRASKNKARITAWASFWPFSVVGTVLNDPIRRLFNFLFNQFKALYQKMSDWVFRKDLELK